MINPEYTPIAEPGDMPMYRMVEETGIDKWPGTFDYALPQAWVDDVHAKTGVYPFGFVWYYNPQSIFGEPVAVTQSAADLLEKYNNA